MKLAPTLSRLFFTLITILTFTACETLKSAADDITGDDSGGDGNKLTNSEVISGLKESLDVGINNAVDLTSKKNGYLKNSEIKIPFPPDAKKVKKKAKEWGMDKQVDKIVTTINRSAEEASKKAVPIFVDAIKNMSINDGFEILNGGEGAATSFLKKNTSKSLFNAFKPDVEKAIEKVNLTKYWEPVVSKYNKTTMLTGNEKVNEDLSGYITNRAIDGLFTMVRKEENKIRKDPMARVNDILKKVFSSLD